MRAADEVEFILLVERLDDVAAKEVTGTAGRDTPAFDVLGIGPEKIAHGTLVGNFAATFDVAHLFECGEHGGETGVDAEDLLLDDGADGEVVEDVGAVAPNVDGAVLAEALVVEAVNLSDLAGFVVTSNKTDAGRILDLEEEKEKEGLDGVVAAIDEIAHEDVVCVGDVAADTEKFEEIEELSMDVSNYGARSGHFVNV